MPREQLLLTRLRRPLPSNATHREKYTGARALDLFKHLTGVCVCVCVCVLACPFLCFSARYTFVHVSMRAFVWGVGRERQTEEATVCAHILGLGVWTRDREAGSST